MRIFALLFCISVQQVVCGQTLGIDSLVYQLSQTSNDTLRARLYKSIADHTTFSNPAVAMKFAKEGMNHVRQMKWQKGIAVFHNIQGALLSNEGAYSDAIKHFETAYKLHRVNGDDYNTSSTLTNIGTAYLRQSAFDKAIKNYTEALVLAEQINDIHLRAVNLNNIATVYFQQNDFDKAMLYHLEALELHRVDKNVTALADVTLSIGNTFLQQKDTLNAKKYYREALRYYEKESNEFGIASVYTNLSIALGQRQENLMYKIKAQEIWNRISPSYPLSISNLGNIVLAYLDKARAVASGNTSQKEREKFLAEADRYLNQLEMLSTDVGNYTFMIGIKAELEAEKGNFKLAYENFKRFHELNDSIYSQENKNKIAAIEGQREVALRDRELAVNKQQLVARRNQVIMLIAGTFLLLAIGAFFYRQSKMRKNMNARLLQLNADLDEANKIKAKFFAIISHDLRAPIARLLNFLHLKRDESCMLSSAQEEEHERRITASAEMLLSNIEDVLLWSKGQMENFRPSMKIVDVSKLFDRVRQSVIVDDEILFSFKVEGNPSIVTDENFAYTILCNLTSNARRVLRNVHDAKIDWRVTQNDKEIILSIADNGPGLDTVWKEQFLNGTELDSGMNGFGFHIIRDLAKAIQCKIKAETNSVGGATFLLFFPKSIE